MGAYQYGGSEAYKREAERRRKQKMQTAVIVIITLAIIGGITAAYYIARARITDSLIGDAGNAQTLAHDIVNAKELSVYGDYDNLDMHAALYADGEKIAGMYEKNTFNPTLYIAAGGEVVYTIGPDKELTDEYSCVAYVFQDAKGHVLGYATENLPGGGFRMLSDEKKDTGIGIEKDGKWMQNAEGDRVVECNYWPGYLDIYDISADFSQSEEPAIYRIFLLYREYLNGYSYNASFGD